MDSMYQEIEKGTKMNFFFFCLVISVASAEKARSWGLIWWPGLDSSEGIIPHLFTACTGTVEWNIYIYIYIYSLSTWLCWASSQQPCDEIVGLFIFCPELWGNKAQAEQPFRMASEVKNTGYASFYYLWVVVQASPGSSKNVLHFTEWWEECQRICTCLKMQQQGLQKLTRDSSMP